MMTALYKVILPGGKPAHGGRPDFVWPLPADGQPGAWVSVSGPLVICENALHLTDSPADWYQIGAELYEAECRGEIVDGGNKLGCREARLVRLLDWEVAQVFTSGVHRVTAGLTRAFDSATVEAFGSATVEAFGSATVQAFDSATVRAFGSATVEAFGSATVISSPYHRAGTDLVKLSDLAVHVDRRTVKVTLRAARGEIGTVHP